MTPFFLPFNLADACPVMVDIAADRVIQGTPRMTTWTIESPNDGGVTSGVWEATPGAWRVDYDKWEFCSILSGVSVLTEDGAEPRTVRAGDAFVIRPGFKGVWNVVETTRKIYVIHRS